MNNFINFICFTETALVAVVIIVNVVSEEERFTILSFPPRVCERKNYSFYNSVLPRSVTGLVFTSMLVIIGWIIYKVNMRKSLNQISFYT